MNLCREAKYNICKKLINSNLTESETARPEGGTLMHYINHNAWKGKLLCNSPSRLPFPLYKGLPFLYFSGLTGGSPRLHVPGCNSLFLNKHSLLEKYLAGILFMISIFGGPYRNPQKTPDLSEAGEQTGEAPTEPTELLFLWLTLEFGGKYPPRSDRLPYLHFEPLQALFKICSESSHFSVKGHVCLLKVLIFGTSAWLLPD